MPKIELAGTSGGFNITSINDNFVKIQEALNDKVLYRDNITGESNVMNNILDMNGYLIINSPSLGGGGGDVGAGGNGTDGFSNATIYAYKRSATFPNTNPGSVAYQFSTHTITTPSTNELANGWTKGIPEGNNPLYVTVATASSLNPVDTILASKWSGPVVLVKDGLTALNTVSLFIYQRTPTNAPPALPTAPVTYTFGVNTIVGLTGNWTSTIPAAINGPYLWVTTATAASTTNSDVIAASEWSPGQLLAQNGLDGANGGSNGLNNATFYAYKRSTTVPINNPGDVTWHFPTALITTPSTNQLANEWFKLPPTGSDQLYVVAASASASTTTDTIAAAEWSAASALGINGLNSATLYIYQRTAADTAPALPSGVVSYDFNTKLITGLTNSWSAAIPVSTGGVYLWVTTATAASGSTTDTIPNTEWAVPNQLSKDGTNGINGTNGTNGTNGSTGTRGTVTIAYAIGSSTWTTTDANNALINAGYFPPINRDIITQYNTATNFSETRFYDAGSWLVLGAYVNGNMLVNGTLSANKVTGGVLDGVQIRVGTGHTSLNSRAFEISSTGVVYTDNIVGGIIRGSNFWGTTGAAMTGVSDNASTQAGVLGQVSATSSGTGSCGVHGLNSINGSSGKIGLGTGYDFYADGSGTNYGPFTGAHDALILPSSEAVSGDILVDIQCVSRSSLSNTIFEVALSTVANDKAAVGVFVQSRTLIEGDVPAAFIAGRQEDGTVETTFEYTYVAATYKAASMNALGEGQINVCGLNGNIEVGDFIVTSTIPGKGMRQLDDLVHNYTVARSREAVTFLESSEVKTIACIYLCG